MRHRRRGKKFSRTADQRRSLVRTMLAQLVLHERLTTSEARAKALRPLAERVVTRAKEGTLASRRMLASRLPEAAAKKLATVIGPRYAGRPGGYTRIIKLGSRSSDASQRAIIEFVR